MNRTIESKWREEVQQFLANNCDTQDDSYIVDSEDREKLLTKIDGYQLEAINWKQIAMSMKDSAESSARYWYIEKANCEKWKKIASDMYDALEFYKGSSYTEWHKDDDKILEMYEQLLKETKIE